DLAREHTGSVCGDAFSSLLRWFSRVHQRLLDLRRLDSLVVCDNLLVGPVERQYYRSSGQTCLDVGRDSTDRPGPDLTFILDGLTAASSSALLFGSCSEHASASKGPLNNDLIWLAIDGTQPGELISRVKSPAVTLPAEMLRLMLLGDTNDK